MPKFHLKIITVSKVVFDDDVDAVYTQGVDGQFGVLYNHVPFMSALEVGVTKVIQDGTPRFFSTMGGAFQIKDNDAVILTPEAEDGTQIDILRAEEAQKRAQARLAQADDENIDIPRAELAMAKAMARIKAAKS